ncbi:hypothetical protein [Filifactor villosus]|uniref:Uncharacterized protein n=1 Tax=Filifactor villosus TaxID=29374 RepID=A0ABV9QKT4_9FIRM
MNRIDRWLLRICWMLQVVVWVTNQMAYGTQNGSALVMPFLWILYRFGGEIVEDFRDLAGSRKSERKHKDFKIWSAYDVKYRIKKRRAA